MKHNLIEPLNWTYWTARNDKCEQQERAFCQNLWHWVQRNWQSNRCIHLNLYPTLSASNLWIIPCHEATKTREQLNRSLSIKLTHSSSHIWFPSSSKHGTNNNLWTTQARSCVCCAIGWLTKLGIGLCCRVIACLFPFCDMISKQKW